MTSDDNKVIQLPPDRRGPPAPVQSPSFFEPEQSLLGAILVRPEVMDRIADLIVPEDFYREAHGKIYHAMVDLHGVNHPVDLVTVCAYLKDRNQLEGVGGPVFLAGLSEAVGFATNADFYARIVRKNSIHRQLQNLLKTLLHKGQLPGTNLDELLTFADSKLLELIESANSNGLRGQEGKNFKGLGELMLEAFNFQNLDLEPKRVILHPWVSEYSIIMIYGPRGVGKTMFVIGLLDAITGGAPFGPWKTITPTRCLYLDGEMPAQDTKERLNFLANGERKEKLIIYSDAYVKSLGLPGANLLNEEWRKAMKEILLQKGIRLWVVDNIASLAPGIDENSKEQWDPVNRWFLDLRSAGVTTIFLHHAGKEGRQRGTSGREDALDISLFLDLPKNYVPEQGARFVVKFVKNRVRNKDLHLLSDTEFSAEAAEDGSYIWTFGSLKKQAKAEVIRMLDESVAPKDIASGLEITQARVSQIRREALRGGLITEAGKLTQSGFQWLQKT